jgi:hypothetical protein
MLLRNPTFIDCVRDTKQGAGMEDPAEALKVSVELL